MRFVDTNVFLRYLTNDDPIKAQDCRRLFQQAELGREQLTTCEAVIGEILYVLCSPRLYKLSHPDAVARLRPLVILRELHLPRKQVYLRALDLFASHDFLDIEDTLIVAHMENRGLQELLSYDADFDRVAGVTRQEP
jgi:predicted nucleic acid-binding protein